MILIATGLIPRRSRRIHMGSSQPTRRSGRVRLFYPAQPDSGRYLGARPVGISFMVIFLSVGSDNHWNGNVR